MRNFYETTTSTGGETTYRVEYIRIEFEAPPAPPPPKPKPLAGMVCAHKFLGVDCKAARAVITSAYRRLAKANHPDTGPAAEREARTRKMAEYNRAYEGALNQL